MATAVQHAYRAYVTAASGPAATPPDLPNLPGDPAELSYDVADLMVLGQPVCQALLTEPDALSRLTAEHVLLTCEITPGIGSRPAAWRVNMAPRDSQPGP